MVIFLLTLLGLTFAIAYYWPISLRLSGCLSLILLALFTYLLTEGLSWIDAIGRRGIWVAWGTLATGIWTWIIWHRAIPWKRIEQAWKHIPSYMGWVALIFVLTGLSGWLYAPNTVDSMVYHLPRMVYWLQHGNLDYFAVQTDRMLYQPPLAEFMMLSLRVMDDTVQTAFFVQWIFGLGCVFAVGLIAEHLGANREAIWSSMFLAGVLPILIVQLSSTKNDVVLAFFVLMSFYFLWVLGKTMSRSTAIWVGITMALAVLTKGTSYVLLFPMGLFWVVQKIRWGLQHPFQWGRLIGEGSIIGLIMVFLCGGFFYRNYSVAGSPLGITQDLFFVYNNEVHQISTFLSVLIKNLSLHFTIPVISSAVESGVIWMHEKILSVDVHDTAISFSRYQLPELGLTEDTAGNFLHFLIWLPALWWVWKNRHWNLLWLTLLGLSSFLLFCFQVKWQPWHSRLHMPLFFLFCVPLGGWMAEWKWRRYGRLGLAMVGILYAVFCFFRPLVVLPPLTSSVDWRATRMAQYYTVNPTKAAAMQEIVSAIQANNWKNIGIRGGDPFGNNEQYPLMEALEEQVDFFPILVTNLSARLEKTPPPVDAILFFTKSPPPTLFYQKVYRQHTFLGEEFYLYSPE